MNKTIILCGKMLQDYKNIYIPQYTSTEITLQNYTATITIYTNVNKKKFV